MSTINNYPNLQKRIEDNYHDILNKICTSTSFEEVNIIVIKVKLERATADNINIFKDFIHKELKENKKYIIDLTDALFMDSTFLGSLVLAFKKSNAKNSKMNFVLNFDKLKILSAIEPLKKILRMHSSIEDAFKEYEQL